MEFRPITLHHKEMFQRYLAGRYHRLITYNFSTFYLWRDWDPYAWCVAENALCLKSDYMGIDTVLCPISPDDEAVFAATEAMIDWYHQQGREFVMSEVDEDMLAMFRSRWPGRFLAEEYPNGANYIYLTEELTSLPGKKFDGKRNHLYRFTKEYPYYNFQPLTDENVPACLIQLKQWFSRHDTESDEIKYENNGVIDALAHFHQLDFQGAVLTLGQRVIAFTMGEPLNKDTFCIHVEKADTDIIGAYQAINNLFVRQFCQDYTYINRAEDMGDPGLRQAKESYHPCRMERKYYLRLANAD